MDSDAVVAGTTSIANREKPQISNDRVVGRGFSTSDYALEDRPFFVPIGKDGITAALRKLDEKLQQAGRSRLLSKKRPGVSWFGHNVPPGSLGLISHGGIPEILIHPGHYPGFPLRNWWGREWCGTQGLSGVSVEFNGLTVVQASQNQAVVVSDPQNCIFVIKHSGFIAYAVEGTYDVVAIVDQSHLENTVRDPVTNTILGWTHEVKMSSQIGTGKDQEYVVALFLNIPVNNCAILQREHVLEQVSGGRHCITNPNVTLRGLYTLREDHVEMPTKVMFTRDQVSFTLRVYLKWKLVDPIKLATRGYSTPYDALRDKTQLILMRIAANLDYGSTAQQQSFGSDNSDNGAHPSSAFLDALRTRTVDEIRTAVLEYGIALMDLAIIDKQFKGEIASITDKLTIRTLQIQVDAANIDRENANKVKQEEGALSVTRIKAQARKAQADSEAYSITATAKAQAEAIRLIAEAEAEAVRIKAIADAQVVDQFAREMGLRRAEVLRVKAFGDRTVFVPSDGLASHTKNTAGAGIAAAPQVNGL